MDEITDDILNELTEPMQEEAAPAHTTLASTSSTATTATTATSSTVLPQRQVSTNSLLVRHTQKGNKVLSLIRNVVWQFSDVAADYVMTTKNCGVLFLTTQYHSLYPEYVFARIRDCGRQYQIRILLLQVDGTDPQPTISEVCKLAVVNEWTVVLAWSSEEAARYLETFKTYENKPPDFLHERASQDYLGQVTSSLTSIRSVNKTDVVTLLTTFGSVNAIANAAVNELRLCPGVGDSKAERIFEAFNQPFFPTNDNKKTKQNPQPVVVDEAQIEDDDPMSDFQIDFNDLHSDDEVWDNAAAADED